MRGGVAALLVAGTLSPAGLTVTASSHEAGAKNVALTVAMHYEMQCGYAGAGPLIVAFPPSAKLPKKLPAGTVLLAGKPTAATVSGNKVSVNVPAHKGMMCDVIGPGSLRLAFTHGAGIGNPPTPGTYHLWATHAKRSFVTNYVVR